MGRHSLLAGDPAEALWYLRKAVELDGDDPCAWQLLGRCFEEMGEEKRARNCYSLAARQLLLSGHDSEAGEAGPLRLFWNSRDPRDA